MNQDPIESLFNRNQGNFDLVDAPQGHEGRFMERLKAQKDQKHPWAKSKLFRPLMAIAAVALLALLVTGVFNSQNDNDSGLAGVSPEMAQTQEFFSIAINDQINILKSFDSEVSKQMVDDTLKQLSTLESQYNLLSKDLVKSGNDKRVVYALIANLQSRIDLLEQMIVTIEQIEILNQTKEDETDNYTL